MSYYTSSFMVNYAELISNSSYLNPSYEGLSKFSIYAGAPVRFVARLIALIAIAVFLAPIGTCYNGVQALIDYPEGRIKLSKKHFFAALNDALYGCVASQFALNYYLSPPSRLLLLTSVFAFIPAALASNSTRVEILSLLLPPKHLKQV